MAIDQHTDYTVIAPCPSHESQAVAKKYFSNTGLGVQETLTYWCATENGAWEVSEFFTETLSVSGTQAQTTAAYSPWQKGSSRGKDRHHQGSGGQDDFATPSDREECHVRCQPRSCPRTEPKGREVGNSPSDMSFRPANEGLRRTDATRGRSFLIRRWWTKETSWQDVSSFGRPREKLWKNMPLQERSGEQLLRVPGPLKTFEPCTSMFLLPTLPRQTSGLCNARDDIWDSRL